MLINVAPVLIALLAGAMLREGISRRLLAGCLIAFSGVVVIGLTTSRHAPSAGTGALLCLAAAVAYAVGVVSQKPALKHASALQVTWLGCTIGLIVCLPFAPELAAHLGTAPARSIGWAVYLGVAPTAVGFMTWGYALARTDAGPLGASTYLVPPLAILFSWALLDQTPAALAIVGGTVCLIGVAVTRWR